MPWLKNKRFTLAAKMTKSGVVGIPEFKFKFENFDRVCFERYRLWDGMAYFIKMVFLIVANHIYFAEIENLLLEIVFSSPCQMNFTEILAKHFYKLNANDSKVYMLHDFTINIFPGQFEKSETT